MKRWTVTVLAAAAALTVGVTLAGARPTSVPTTITHDGSVDLGNGKFLLSGQVTSHRELCRFFRIVKVTAHYPDGTTRLLDQDLTSDAGAWAVKADISGAERLKAKVRVGKIYGGHGGRYRTRHPKVVCKAASVVWRVA
jgi:hypothetical protein